MIESKNKNKLNNVKVEEKNNEINILKRDNMSNKHILLSLQQELLSKELIIEENNIVIKKLQLEKNALFNENQKKENIIKELNYKIIELEQKDKMKDIEKNTLFPS